MKIRFDARLLLDIWSSVAAVPLLFFFPSLLSTRFLRRLAARMVGSGYLSVQGRPWFDDASIFGPRTKDAASDWQDN